MTNEAEILTLKKSCKLVENLLRTDWPVFQTGNKPCHFLNVYRTIFRNASRTGLMKQTQLIIFTRSLPIYTFPFKGRKYGAQCE